MLASLLPREKDWLTAFLLQWAEDNSGSKESGCLNIVFQTYYWEWSLIAVFVHHSRESGNDIQTGLMVNALQIQTAPNEVSYFRRVICNIKADGKVQRWACRLLIFSSPVIWYCPLLRQDTELVDWYSCSFAPVKLSQCCCFVMCLPPLDVCQWHRLRASSWEPMW